MSFCGWRIARGAGAVEAAVCGAGAAAEDELFAQGGAGSVGADGGVAWGDGVGSGVGGEGGLAEVDLAQEGGVGGS